MIDAGHFWAQNHDSITEQNLFFLDNLLNAGSVKLEEVREDEKIKVGHLYAAKFTEDDKYYRCKVLHIKPWKRSFVSQVITQNTSKFFIKYRF